MRKRNPLASARTRNISASLSDLITQSQHTMSSQASVYTNHSKRSQINSQQFPQSGARSQDFDDYEDIISDDIDTLFITPEQEKKIQSILQLARKGKINAGNAFQIPVRVIDPQLTESSNMRFWKFSSQLLSVSMSIYDKRVENMYQNTNKMFDNLIRVQGRPDKPLTDEQVEQKQKKQRGQLIQMQVGDVGKLQTISSYEIGSVNCDQPQKVNIKSLHGQFLPDPLFQKRLQAFDSNSLKSLFMNVFECGKDMQITFFNREQAKSEEVKMEIEAKIQEKIEQSMQEYEDRIPKFIFQQFSSLRNFSNSSNIYGELSNFRKQNIRQSVESVHYEVKDFTDELKLFKNLENKAIENNEDGSETNSLNSFHGQNEFNFQFNISEHTQISQDKQFQSQSVPHSLPSESQSYNQFYYQKESQYYTQMTPWELQFKGMKLQKKKKRSANQSRKRTNKISPKNQNEIDFMDGNVETRKAVFAIKSTKMTQNDDYEQVNLNPKTMNPFSQVYKKKKKGYLMAMNHSQQNKIKQTSFLDSREINQIKVEHTQIQNEQTFNFPEEGLSNTQRTTNYQSNLFHQQHQTQGFVYRSTGIRNLRELKQKIYKRILQGRSVRLSELNINMNPNSILIIFLHLVNENNLEIRQLDGEYDIEICIKNQQ